VLLAIRGHEGGRGPTIGEVADHLLVKHHTVVGLVDRAQALDLVVRRHDGDDHRVVRLAVTRRGAAKLRALSAAHLEELARLAPVLGALTDEPDSPRTRPG
jgi:DNA-binding MarR family transcriptional regulator